MKVLVTGGAGFVGSHLVSQLLERGDDVRVLVRPTSSQKNLQGRDVTQVVGDLQDPASLRQAVEGCAQVFHCAADYRLWSRDPRELYRINVDGTDHLLRACRDAQVERIIYTSSVAAIGIPKDGTPGDEETPVRLEDMIGHYKRSKFLAQEVALKHAREGLPVVIVNPSTPIGPQDLKPTATGKIITDFLTGKMPAYVDTGLNLVAVEDVARGHLLAAEKGVPGRLYILGNTDLTLKQILDILADITGQPAPRVRLPYAFVYVLAWLENLVTAGLLKRHPFIPLEGVKMARKRMWFASDRARRELGYSPGPVRGALERACAWFFQNGYV